MKKYRVKKLFNIFAVFMLIIPTYLTSFSHGFAQANNNSSPWETISEGGNEVNEVVNKNGKEYVRLGSGEGNDNVNNPAVFREKDAKGKESGTMKYTFIPETASQQTRFGFYPHFKDTNNFIFVGYDVSSGWFWEYKYEGEGEFLSSESNVAIPEQGNEYTLKIDYDGTTISADVNGDSLFDSVSFDEKLEKLIEHPEAVKLGQYGEENSQVLIELSKSSEENGEMEDDESENDENNDTTPPGDSDWEEGPFKIENDHFEEGDFEVIQGNGSLTYNEDGSVTFDVPSGSNKIVYTEMPEFFEGSFEVDVTANTDLTRFGLIYRVLDEDNYNYVGIGDTINNYFMEIFGPKNEWTAMTQGPDFVAGETFTMKVEFAEDYATLYIDGEEIDTWELEGGVSDPGLIGFDKSRGEAEITISNLKIEGTVPTPRPVEDTIRSEYMDVVIDSYFPRIIRYEVDDKVLDGQETSVNQLEINGKSYTPSVKYDKVSDHEAIYELTVNDEHGEGIIADMTVSLKVDDNKVYLTFEEITNRGEEKIETIELIDNHFISVHSNQTGAEARLTNISNHVNELGDVDVSVDENMEGIGTSDSYYVGVLSTDELSASMWTSSEVDGHGNLIANRYEREDGSKALGLMSNTFIYHHKEMDEPTSIPSVKVAIAEDLNGDNVVDWQDGAIAYRDIMQDIKGWQNVNNQVATRIAMNFGSQAQQPFLKTLDNVRKVALATDGIGQSVLLKGYGNEGHDSAHPDYGDVGEKMGGEEDLNTLIEKGAEYNAEFGVHINAQETYPEADAFSDDLIHGIDDQGWGWLDQAYVIDKMYDLTSGLRAKRLDDLKEAAPWLSFIYLDVWYQDQWESNRITDQFYERDWRMTTEFSNVLHNSSTWEHWATDKNYGGKELKGKNSELLRFISNHQRDSWVLNAPEWGGTADNPLLGGFELAGFEGWQSDKNFDNFIHMTFNTNIPTKFLQKYYVTNWITEEGDPSEKNLEKEIRLKDPSNDDEVVVKRKNNSRGRTIYLNGHVILDEDTDEDHFIDDRSYLIPWVEQDFENPTPKAEKLYHWNLKGGETTWTLPEDFEDLSKVYVYELTDQGRANMQEVDVIDGEVTLNAKASTPYVVIPEEDDGLEVTDWSSEAHVYDTGFNSGTVEDEHTTITGDEDSVSVLRTDQQGSARNLSSGDYYLNIEDPTEKTTISRKITDLIPGEDYVAEVYVENQSDEKAFIEVIGGEKDVNNYTLRSLQKNYVKADSHATNDGYDSKMQRMQVSFTAKNDTAQLVLGRESGKGITKFDDIRIVQKSLTNEVNPRVFEQDFETVVQGIYPFVIGNTEGVEDNRIHLSEKHEPYTQKGWGNRVVDDVIDGNWSLKTNTGNPGLLYRTIPQHFRFEPGITYKVSFDYQTSANKVFRFISGDQENDARNINDVEGLEVNELLPAARNTNNVEFTVTGSENGQTYIGIFSDGTTVDMATGAGTFILDNLRIEKLAPGLSVEDETVYAGEDLDLRSLITFAENSEGTDVTKDVLIDKGDFDPDTPGEYTITYTLKEDGFDDVVKTATVKVDLKPANWYSGEGKPQDIIGEVGDFYVDITTGDIYQKDEDGWQLTGSFHEDDSEGSEWSFGEGKPDPEEGKSGDLYLDIETGDIYIKRSEDQKWEFIGNLRESTEEDEEGATWIVDEGEPSDDIGDKNDLYLDTKTGDVYVKSEDGWDLIANLQDSQDEEDHSEENDQLEEEDQIDKDDKDEQNGDVVQQDDDESKGEHSGDNKLPKTATSMFNWLVLGLIMASVGLMLFIKRKIAKIS